MDFAAISSQFKEFFTVEITHQIVSLVRLGLLMLVGVPLIFIVAKWVKRSITRKFSAQQGMIVSKIILYSGLAVVVFSFLNELGFKLSHLLGAAGILGIAVGLASQTSVSNIISGFFLIAEKPFEVDDIITVGDKTGVIISIDMLSLKMRTFDNKFVRIPNETIIKNDVINITRFPIRRVDLNVGVAYKEDIGRVREVLMSVAKNNPLCLNDPEPLVIFQGFGSSSLDFLFVTWVQKSEWLTLKNSIAEDVKKRFDEEGIEIPFPHLSLYKGSETEPIPIHIVANPGASASEQTRGESNA